MWPRTLVKGRKGGGGAERDTTKKIERERERNRKREAHRHTQTQLSVAINLLHFVPFYLNPSLTLSLPFSFSAYLRAADPPPVHSLEIESKLATLSEMKDATKCRFRGTLTKIRGHYVNKVEKERMGDVTHFCSAIHAISRYTFSR